VISRGESELGFQVRSKAPKVSFIEEMRRSS